MEDGNKRKKTHSTRTERYYWFSFICIFYSLDVLLFSLIPRGLTKIQMQAN